MSSGKKSAKARPTRKHGSARPGPSSPKSKMKHSSVRSTEAKAPSQANRLPGKPTKTQAATAPIGKPAAVKQSAVGAGALTVRDSAARKSSPKGVDKSKSAEKPIGMVAKAAMANAAAGRDKSSGGKKKGRSVAEAASTITADSKGYVFINGRRVR